MYILCELLRTYGFVPSGYHFDWLIDDWLIRCAGRMVTSGSTSTEQMARWNWRLLCKCEQFCLLVCLFFACAHFVTIVAVFIFSPWNKLCHLSPNKFWNQPCLMKKMKEYSSFFTSVRITRQGSATIMANFLWEEFAMEKNTIERLYHLWANKGQFCAELQVLKTSVKAGLEELW